MVHVLVVDDDAPTREVLRMMLEDAGYVVVEAGDGASALQNLRSTLHRFVVLLDQLMPTLDGISLLRTVASDTLLAGAHAFVLMTADARPLAPEEELLLTRLAAPLVRKPFDIDVLLNTVASCAARLAAP